MNNNFQNDIKKCIETLNNGGVILYPTDTIWGLGCDATNINAVERIYKIKQRTDSKSLIVLLENIKQLRDYVELIPPDAIELIMQNKQPTTIIYQRAKNLASNVIAADGSIGIRLPNDDFCQNILKRLGKPLVSTSANISAMPPPQNFSEIDSQIIKSVDYVVQWRQDDLTKSSPSAIILFKKDGSMEKIR